MRKDAAHTSSSTCAPAEAMYVGMPTMADGLVPYVEHQEMMTDRGRAAAYVPADGQQRLPARGREPPEGQGPHQDRPGDPDLPLRRPQRPRRRPAGQRRLHAGPQHHGTASRATRQGRPQGRPAHQNGWKNAGLPWTYKLEKQRCISRAEARLPCCFAPTAEARQATAFIGVFAPIMYRLALPSPGARAVWAPWPSPPRLWRHPGPRRQDPDGIKSRGQLALRREHRVIGFSAADSRGSGAGWTWTSARPSPRRCSVTRTRCAGYPSAPSSVSRRSSRAGGHPLPQYHLELTRDAARLHFAGVTYYDGQGFWSPKVRR